MSPPPTKIRIGIIGCANITKKVGRAIQHCPNATLQAIASRTLERAQAFAKANSFPSTTTVYGTYEEVLNDPNVDAVYVPIPTSLHLSWGIAIARKKKHLLLEKPCAMNVAELDQIISACEENGVQFMDCTMWVHHPRSKVMADFIADPQRFGQLKSIQTCFNYTAEYPEDDIHMRPDLDGLGALGDAGWYCIRASLFVANYELPKYVTALKNPVFNKLGVIMQCSAALQWENGAISTFNCTYYGHLTMDIAAYGTKGSLKVSDFVIPYEEKSCELTTMSNGNFGELSIGWSKKPTVEVITTDTPQEVLMIKEFCSLVDGVKNHGLAPEKKWPAITRKAQLIIDAVVASLKQDFKTVEVY